MKISLGNRITAAEERISDLVYDMQHNSMQQILEKSLNTNDKAVEKSPKIVNS